MTRVEWTEPAVTDLENIRTYIAEPQPTMPMQSSSS